MNDIKGTYYSRDLTTQPDEIKRLGKFISLLLERACGRRDVALFRYHESVGSTIMYKGLRLLIGGEDYDESYTQWKMKRQ